MGSVQLGAAMYKESENSLARYTALVFLDISHNCILPFSFREEEGKKEIKSLQKQLQDVKKETEIELQVRLLNTGHRARGKCVSKLAPAAQELALR